MKKKNQLKNILVVFAVIIIGSLGYWYWQKSQPGKLDEFAQCLSDKGAKFYGAFWCPHCQAQKALFGNSKSKLPYIECSTPDSKGQTQACADKKIESYPTWTFQVASSTGAMEEVFETGEHTLQELSDKTGCVLPAGTAGTSVDKGGASEVK